MDRLDLHQRIEALDRLPSNNSFGLADVFLSEEELSIQVGNIDRVEIDHREFLAAHEHQVL